MSFSSGTFTLVAGNPVVTATTISSTWANNTLSDIATGLSTCVLKDGTQTTTATIPFAFGITIPTGQSVTGAGTAKIDGFSIGSVTPGAGAFTTLGATTGTGTIGWGTYTPVASALSNMDSVTPTVTSYSRNGNHVQVSGTVTTNPTAASAAAFSLDLPIASNIAAISDLGGAAICDVAYEGVTIYGNVANNVADFKYNPTGTSAQTITFSFGYRII